MTKFAVFLLFSMAIISGCEGRKEMRGGVQTPSVEILGESDSRRLSSARFYFGHQSVGNNMVDGVRKILQGNPRLDLKIVNANDLEFPKGPAFVHFDVGKNDDPVSKITHFDNNLRRGWGENADVAMFKFCFWDIRRETDIERVFRKYRETIAGLHSTYPKLKIVHFTVPLMRRDNGWKASVKRVLGGIDGSDLDNIRRNELSDMILREYLGKEPVFDIARIEATLPDGKTASFTRNGKSYQSLAGEYTKDGGHLNDLGRIRVAERFLVVLANAAGD